MNFVLRTGDIVNINMIKCKQTYIVPEEIEKTDAETTLIYLCSSHRLHKGQLSILFF